MVTASAFASGMVAEQTFEYICHHQHLPVCRAPRQLDLVDGTDFLYCLGIHNGKKIILPIQISLRKDCGKYHNTANRMAHILGKEGSDYMVSKTGLLISLSEGDEESSITQMVDYIKSHKKDLIKGLGKPVVWLNSLVRK